MSGSPRRFDHDEARRLRAEGARLVDIARQFGVSDTTIRFVTDADYRARRGRGRPRTKVCPDCQGSMIAAATRCRPCWKRHAAANAGAIKTDEQGYLRQYVSGRRFVLQHRLVMEQALGRRLERHEIVHHRNHIRADNRLENLELLQSPREHHARHRTHDWADIVALYQRGHGCTVIGAVLGISPRTVFNAVTRSEVVRSRTEAAAVRPRDAKGHFIKQHPESEAVTSASVPRPGGLCVG